MFDHPTVFWKEWGMVGNWRSTLTGKDWSRDERERERAQWEQQHMGKENLLQEWEAFRQSSELNVIKDHSESDHQRHQDTIDRVEGRRWKRKGEWDIKTKKTREQTHLHRILKIQVKFTLNSQYVVWVRRVWMRSQTCCFICCISLLNRFIPNKLLGSSTQWMHFLATWKWQPWKFKMAHFTKLVSSWQTLEMTNCSSLFLIQDK